MRARRLAHALAAILTASAPAVAAAQPQTTPGPGFVLEEVPLQLQVGSGAAQLDSGFVFTDLGTGQVVRLDGATVTTLANLPVGTDVLGYPTGPYKVGLHNGQILVSQGWPDVNRAEGPMDHALLSVSSDGTIHAIARDFWNPYDFEGAGDDLFIVDSGKNVLFRLSPAGHLTEHFAFASIEHDESALQTLSPTEFNAGQKYTVEAVPTGLAVAPDVVHVALFGGFPFLDGGGRVVAVPIAGGDKRARIELSGLNAPTDVALDRDGRLLVLEFGRFDADKGFLPGTGRLLSVDLATGVRTIVLDGLTQPATVLPVSTGGYIVTQMGGPVLRAMPRE